MTHSDNVLLELITDPDLIEFTYTQNSHNFKLKGLAKADYIHIERKLNTEFLVPIDNVGVYHFVLRDLSIIVEDGDRTGNIVSSVSTYNRKAWKVEPKGDLKEVIAPCVGYVFTLPEHRKKGYAIEMVKKVNQYWDERLKDSFLFLYSGVGEFYSKAGYISYNTSPHSIDVTDNLPENTGDEGVKYLGSVEEDYKEIVELENQNIKEGLLKKAADSDGVLVSLTQDTKSILRYHLKDKFNTSKLRPALANDKFGVLLENKDFVTWYHDWGHDEFIVLSLRYSSLESFKRLINYSLGEAKRFGFTKASVWDANLSQELYRESLEYLKELGAQTTEINGTLPAIRLTDDSTGFHWENNEKWCWF